jgi:hypothetical protein
MRTVKELLKAFMDDEKLLSRDAPIEALGPEMSERAIQVLKSVDIVTVGDFQDMRLPELGALNCERRIHREILSHWHDIEGD